MVFCAFKIVPSWFANYQLQDAITTEARFATSTYPKKTPEDIQDDVFKKAQELGVPAKKEDIKVTFDGIARHDFAGLLGNLRFGRYSDHSSISSLRRQPSNLDLQFILIEGCAEPVVPAPRPPNRQALARV